MYRNISLNAEQKEKLRLAAIARDKALGYADTEFRKESIKANKIFEDAKKEAHKIIAEASSKNYSDRMKAREEYDKVVKSIQDEIEASEAKYRAELDPMEIMLAEFLGMPLEKLYANHKQDEEDAAHEKAESKKKFDVMSDDELLNYINENLVKLSDDAKRYYGLVNARAIKTRAVHLCEDCGEVITDYSLAIVASKYMTYAGETFSYFWDNEYEFSVEDGKLFVDEDGETTELKLYKVWYDLKCAAAIVDKALEMTDKLNK